MADGHSANDSKVTTFPVVMYKVSKEWINGLFCEIKRVVMAKALDKDCSKEFLASLNQLKYELGNDSKVTIYFEEPAAASADLDHNPSAEAASETQESTALN